MERNMNSFGEVYIPENQGKHFRVHCPSCKGDKLDGSSIFLWCKECLWAGQIQECLFGDEI